MTGTSNATYITIFIIKFHPAWVGSLLILTWAHRFGVPLDLLDWEGDYSLDAQFIKNNAVKLKNNAIKFKTISVLILRLIRGDSHLN